MAKLKVKFSRPRLKGWPFVVIMGLVLAVLAVIDRGGLAAVPSASDGSTGCELRVSTAPLNVRTGPSQQAESVQTLALGATLDATTVLTSGYRQLKDGHWVFDEYVTPMPGSTCS